MNLSALVGGIIATVNPTVVASYQASTPSGYTTAADGARTAVFEAAVNVTVQRQPLTGGDLRQIDGLNLQGELCALYISGDWAGVSRADQTGGDVVTMPDSTTWLVVQKLEDFYLTAGWIKVACVRQQ